MSATTSKQQTKSNIRYEFVKMMVPPDGGWGWVIVSASFFINLTVDGILYTFGLFIEEIANDFNTKEAKIAIVTSLMTGFYYFLGPCTCALINKYGFRTVAIIGNIFSVVGLFAASTLKNLPLFIIITGCLTGIGFNMIFTSAILIINFYFERWRPLATSISVCGSSVGVIVFPIIFANFPNNFTWRSKFKVLAGLCGLTGIASLTYKPIKTTIQQINVVEEVDSSDSIQLEHTYSIKQLYQHLYNANFPIDLGTDRSLMATETTSKLSQYDSSGLSINSPSENVDAQGDKLLTTVFEEDEHEINKNKKICSKTCWKSLLTARKHIAYNNNRPLYKEDIFFPGSIYTLPEYSKMTIPPSSSSKKSCQILYENDPQQLYNCCPLALKNVLTTMLDFNLLKSPSFFLIVLSSFFTILGMYVPFLFIVQRAKEMDINKKWSYSLLTLIGISNTIGRILCGLISSFPKKNYTLIISYITTFICGVTSIISNYTRNLVGQIVYALIFGSTIASMAALRSSVLVQLVGLDKLTNAFGIMLIFEGIASFIGITVAGLLRDYSENYDNTFLFSGLSILFSSILMVPIKIVLKWEKRKEENYMVQ